MPLSAVGYSWVPRYYDLESDDIRKNKNVLLGGCGYTFKQHFLCALPRSGIRTVASSSRGMATTVTVSATRAIRRSFSVQYANYAGTRYPGHDSGSGKFREGTISLIWFLPI